jgi:2,3-diketo-5-methylthio-1-phosphopentane phosphatase
MSATKPLPAVYLLDVEGTIAPISLVAEQLFPYARKHFESFLKCGIADIQKNHESLEQSLEEGSLMRDLLMLSVENRAEEDPEAPRMLPPGLARGQKSVGTSPSAKPFMSSSSFIPAALTYIYWLMDRDRKSTALKSLQGRIWKSGFESGVLKGQLFADVPPALERWSLRGRVAIYSSGSVDAQKLFFRYSTFGDISALVSNYFDTRTGAKTSAKSYLAIAAAMKVAPGEACFFSDVVRELDPAREAGMTTRLVVRTGNALVDDARGHMAIESFDELQ